MAKFTEEERDKLILEIADYIIETVASTRKAAEKFGISNYSVSDYMNNRLQRINFEKYKQVKSVLDGNKPKTIADPNIRKRILEEAKLINSGMTAAEVAQYFGISVDVIHDDLTSRLPKIDEDLAHCVAERLKMNSMNNLIVTESPNNGDSVTVAKK